MHDTQVIHFPSCRAHRERAPLLPLLAGAWLIGLAFACVSLGLGWGWLGALLGYCFGGSLGLLALAAPAAVRPNPASWRPRVRLGEALHG